MRRKKKVKSVEKHLEEWAMQEFDFSEPCSWEEMKIINREYFGADFDLHNRELFSFAKFMHKKLLECEQKK
jgi:hypothetical protein